MNPNKALWGKGDFTRIAASIPKSHISKETWIVLTVSDETTEHSEPTPGIGFLILIGIHPERTGLSLVNHSVVDASLHVRVGLGPLENGSDACRLSPDAAWRAEKEQVIKPCEKALPATLASSRKFIL